jgi:hypothetical protein
LLTKDSRESTASLLSQVTPSIFNKSGTDFHLAVLLANANTHVMHNEGSEPRNSNDGVDN